MANSYKNFEFTVTFMKAPAETIVKLVYSGQFLIIYVAIATGVLKSFTNSSYSYGIYSNNFLADIALFNVKWLPGLDEYTINGVVKVYHVLSFKYYYNYSNVLLRAIEAYSVNICCI